MVAMRMRNSAFKNSLKMIPLGAKLRVSPPIGSFTLHRYSSKPAVFLVGGIGITPVLSILAHATEQTRVGRSEKALQENREGFNLLYWNQHGMTFWAVSDLGNDEMQALARLLQNQTGQAFE